MPPSLNAYLSRQLFLYSDMMRTTFLTLVLEALISASNALTFTSPLAGASIDPSQPITVSWVSSANDPPVFDLVLDQSGALSLTRDVAIASSISTSRGSYSIPAHSAMTYGSGFVFKAQSGDADIATSRPFDLSINLAQVTSGGSTQIVQVTTFTNTVSANAASTVQISSSVSVLYPVSNTAGSAVSISAVRSNLDGAPATTSTSVLVSPNRSTTSGTPTVKSSSLSAFNTAATSAPVATLVNGQSRLVGPARIVAGAAGIVGGIILAA